MNKPPKITIQQERFVDHYLKDQNATRAAISAGYSEKTAHATGCRLLKDRKVVAFIENARRLQQRRTNLDADWVLEQYRQVWEAKLTDIIQIEENGDWAIRPLWEWPDIWLKMVTPRELKRLKERSKDGKELSWDDVGQLIKLNVADKFAAVTKIGEHTAVNAFPTKSVEIHQHVHLESLETALSDGRKRLLEAGSTVRLIHSGEDQDITQPQHLVVEAAE